jgi:hypothetical protein
LIWLLGWLRRRRERDARILGELRAAESTWFMPYRRAVDLCSSAVSVGEVEASLDRLERAGLVRRYYRVVGGHRRT